MRFLLAACLLAGLSAAPALEQWDDDVSGARRGTEDEGYGRRDRDGPRFRADDDDARRDLDRRDRRAFGRDDPDEIMPRRRDRDRDDRDRRDAEGRWRDDRLRSGNRYDPYDRYPPYGSPVAPPASGGVFVVPPPIPGARR